MYHVIVGSGIKYKYSNNYSILDFEIITQKPTYRDTAILSPNDPLTPTATTPKMPL
jgi:hypothetical protein